METNFSSLTRVPVCCWCCRHSCNKMWWHILMPGPPIPSPVHPLQLVVAIPAEHEAAEEGVAVDAVIGPHRAGDERHHHRHHGRQHWELHLDDMSVILKWFKDFVMILHFVHWNAKMVTLFHDPLMEFWVIDLMKGTKKMISYGANKFSYECPSRYYETVSYLDWSPMAMMDTVSHV